MKQELHIRGQEDRYRQHFLKKFFCTEEKIEKIPQHLLLQSTAPCCDRGPWLAAGLLGTLCQLPGLARCGHQWEANSTVSCHPTASRLRCHDSHLRLCLLGPPTQLPFWSEVRDSPCAVCSRAWRPFLSFPSSPTHGG